VTSPVGAIVAGGRATRFGGRPKGLERVGGARIIDRVATALRAVASDLMVISNTPDADQWISGVRVYGDVRSESGSLIGLHTALTHASHDVLVVAWDMPFVSTALLELIRDRASPSTLAVVPEGPRGLNPFCALYKRDCLALVAAAIESGDLRLSHVIAHLPSIDRIPLRDVEMVGDPATLLFNVNTPEDLARAEAIEATRRPK
jgi:molybdopterin-guanine dinucleotide biosynthesis protein A